MVTEEPNLRFIHKFDFIFPREWMGWLIKPVQLHSPVSCAAAAEEVLLCWGYGWGLLAAAA